MSDMPGSDQTVKAKLILWFNQLSLYLQSVGLMPPLILILMQYYQDRDGKRLAIAFFQLLGYAFLMACIIVFGVAMLQKYGQ